MPRRWTPGSGEPAGSSISPECETRSNTSVCLKFAEGGDPEAQAALVKKMAGLLEAEGVGYDLASYRDAPPGLRLWCGATVDTDDLEALFPWLDWARHEARA